MQLQGTIEVLMDSKNQKTGKVDGAIIKLDTFDSWLKTASYRSKVEEAGFKNGGKVLMDVQEHTSKSGKNYYTFDIADVTAANETAPAQKPAPSQKQGYTPKKSSYNPDGARLGMAFNNAIQVAIAQQKVSDEKFIRDYTVKYFNLVGQIEDTIQNGSIQQDSLDDSLDGIFGNPV